MVPFQQFDGVHRVLLISTPIGFRRSRNPLSTRRARRRARRAPDDDALDRVRVARVTTPSCGVPSPARPGEDFAMHAVRKVRRIVAGDRRVTRNARPFDAIARGPERAVDGMRLALAIPVVFSALLATTSAARAQTPERKFARGFAGMTLGVLEIPGNMVVESDGRGPGEGLPFGFAKGLGMVVVRTLVGVYEFVSAPLPAPEDFRPILEPEFPWDYFGMPESTADADRT
jgi:putative exosortase-associated protein (TIGR04073 family)